MGFYEQQILPRVIDKLLGGPDMARVRERSLEGLHGVVLEVGFGSGPNVPLYPEAVTHVYAVDPSMVGRKLAAERVAASSIPVEYIGLDGQSLPLDDEVVDCVLSTWTLCSIPDPDRALAEIRRVLKPSGALYFLEHGRSTDARIARRQRRLTPLQRHIAGGCHLDRDIGELVRVAGFELDRFATFTIAGPKTMSFMYSGVATKHG